MKIISCFSFAGFLVCASQVAQAEQPVRHMTLKSAGDLTFDAQGNLVMSVVPTIPDATSVELDIIRAELATFVADTPSVKVRGSTVRVESAENRSLIRLVFSKDAMRQAGSAALLSCTGHWYQTLTTEEQVELNRAFDTQASDNAAIAGRYAPRLDAWVQANTDCIDAPRAPEEIEGALWSLIYPQILTYLDGASTYRYLSGLFSPVGDRIAVYQRPIFGVTLVEAGRSWADGLERYAVDSVASIDGLFQQLAGGKMTSIPVFVATALTDLASHSTLDRIIDALRMGQGQKELQPYTRLIDRLLKLCVKPGLTAEIDSARCFPAPLSQLFFVDLARSGHFLRLGMLP